MSQYEKELMDLPQRPERERLVITDSHDVTGLNNDGFLSTYSYLYRTDEGLVLFDCLGAGCIRVVRTIGYNGRLKVYTNGADAPEIDISFDELYSGGDKRFPRDLVCDEVRGHGSAWCYKPIPFSSGCRVVATDPPESYHFFTITAHVWSEDRTGLRDRSPGACQHICGGLDLRPYDCCPLLVETTGGLIYNLELQIPAESLPYALEHVRLRMRWEREGEAIDLNETPAVEAPLGLFFAIGYSGFAPDTRVGSYTIRNMNTDMIIPTGRINAQAAPVGERGGVYYCRFPMPYWKSARIELVNTGEAAVQGVSFTLDVTDNPYPTGSGHLHALYRREDGTIPHKDFVALDVRGCGKFVGAVMRMTSRGFNRQSTVVPRIYLEGDARFYIDDAQAFQSASTGTEEYFNWGWYDIEGKDEVFSFPTHGYPEHVRYLEDHTTMYRFHLTDYVPYYRAFRFELEHGPEGQQVADYNSVAFYYDCGKPMLTLTDVVDAGNVDSEAEHEYRVVGGHLIGRKRMCYEGCEQALALAARDATGEDRVMMAGIEDDGRVWSGSCEFKVSVPEENRGVRLRRRFDGRFPESESLPGCEGTRVVPSQSADVFVDGESAGCWYLPAHHARDCWMEDEYELPRRLTTGRTNLRIRLQASQGSLWNEYRYWIFAYLGH